MCKTSISFMRVELGPFHSLFGKKSFVQRKMFFCLVTRQKKNISLYFFTKLKTYPLSYSIYKT